MACILARGFEYNSFYDFDTLSSVSGLTISSSYNRSGGGAYALAFGAAAVAGGFNIPSTSEFYMQIAIRMNTRSGSCHVIKWKAGSTILGSLYWDNTAGLWKFYTGDAATLVATATSASVPTTGVYGLLEIYVNIADSGTLTMRWNGIQDMTFSGDTKPGADTAATLIEINATATFYYYLDDVVINDATGSAPGNSWPSGAFVTALVPSGAGATTQWTPSTGSNYACVDEIPPSNADYVSVNANDQIDSYAMGNLPAGAYTVLGVDAAIFAVKIPNSTPTKLKHLIRHSGTDYPIATGIDVPVISTFPIRKCWAQNPGTSADWTLDDVNNMEFGFKSAA